MAEKNYWTTVRRTRVTGWRLSRRRLIRLGALGAAGAAGAAYLGCGGDDGDKEGEGGTPGTAEMPTAVGTPVRGGTFAMVVSGALSTMDPAYYTHQNDKLNYNVYDFPITEDLDETRSLIAAPVLAESWELVDDWHFTLHWRHGVKFQDDTDFDSAAIQAHFDRIRDPATQSSHTPNLRDLDRLETIDAFTTSFWLNKEKAQLLGALNGWMASIPSPSAVEKWGDSLRDHPVGSGPFMLKSTEAGASYEYERFPGHWRQSEPYLDGFKLRVIPDKAVAAASLKSGEADYAEQGELEIQDIIAFREDPDFNVIVAGAASLGTIFIHKGRAPGNNIHLRKAISYAINREEFVEKYSGLAFITPGPLPKYSLYETPDEPDPVFDPEKAKEELKAAGYEDGITIKIIAMAEPTSQSDIELLAAQLAKVGISVESEFVAVSAAGAKISNAEYDFAYGPWPVANPGDIQYAMANIYHSKGFFNNGATNDPEIDELVDSTVFEPDANKRRDVFRKAMRIINENAYLVYVAGTPEIKVIRKNLHGFIPMNEPGGFGLEKQFRRMWIA